MVDWEAAGPYHGIDEFVESIPFTQTREYVQAILRNIEIYRAIDASAATGGHMADGRLTGARNRLQWYRGNPDLQLLSSIHD